MQLMTWPLSRLGSRFGLLFEPERRRVMHSALGRFLDRPLDLAVGLVEPDGTERVLPFAERGRVFYGTEQFERINSVTYRGHSEQSGLRFELNLHSPFYPQNEQLCLMPVFYVELRIAPAPRVRLRSFNRSPSRVRLFLRLRRPQTEITAEQGRIDLSYDVPLTPQYDAACGSDQPDGSTDDEPPNPEAPRARVTERIQSLNDGAEPITDADGGTGLTLELPVTEEGSGIKWRLVWAAHTTDPVLEADGKAGRFRYNRHWPDIDAVMRQAIETRDDNLALSRRFEKLLEQPPLNRARWHLLVLAFHSYLSNTFWCDLNDGEEFFSVWEGNFMYHNTLDVGYNLSLLYFALWPRLLRLGLDQWARHHRAHEPSDGAILLHDFGRGLRFSGQAHELSMPVEENANFLLMLQAYAHWTGDAEIITRHGELVERTARYLLWCDREGNGFPSEGTANAVEKGNGSEPFARRQTYLAIKRTCALEAAADLLDRAGQAEQAERCRKTAEAAVPKIERSAWLGDHYADSVDQQEQGLLETWGDEALALDQDGGWDDYSIYTANALLLPMMTGQPIAYDSARIRADLFNAHRENLRAYGCGHTTSRNTSVWLSQNIWRDHVSRYLHAELWELDARYWDLLVFANTQEQSFGYIDTYIGNELAFNPRGATAFGVFLAGPRLVIDRLDTELFAVDPDRNRPQRWPLLPLADWEAGKIPVCVVDEKGGVSIESEIEPVKVRGHPPQQPQGDTIG